jgi:predicted NAD-dependent protein-ADP-ribosyltransferase YbiA (DUF1768 family)
VEPVTETAADLGGPVTDTTVGLVEPVTAAAASNFYPCSIRYKGKTFPSVEHAYQYTKAVHHKDLFMARLVFSAAAAWECKILSHRIVTSRHWFS